MVKPLEGDGLIVKRCEGCGGLSIVMLRNGEPIAYVCPPDNALVQLADVIVQEIIRAKPATETVQ